MTIEGRNRMGVGAGFQHPEGMLEGSQGQAKRSPWDARPNIRALKGRKISYKLEPIRSCVPPGRGSFMRTIPGAALRLPLATLSHPYGMPERSEKGLFAA